MVPHGLIDNFVYSAMINALEKSENEPNVLQDLINKASKKLNKVSNEANIREYMENLSDKSGAEMYVFHSL